MFAEDKGEAQLQKTLCSALLLIVLCSSPVLSAQMNGEAARDWPVLFRDTLQHTVLQFWIDHALDKESGGLLGQLNRAGNRLALAISLSC